ncbi:hypothetical protein CLV63_1124 [Murinocardiopsis flavida]|uniref:Uncharacterized protein n=1 Tax=Murinocardiopsis flavida TaxID=645275 RepID=A0A2P8DFY3_9ACTN|nr:hypothetical protein [Murinocardiopsis flavida]PSK96122.1 hypothetical protein CLV63_1124 [Murinocardiopsis flavida]
MTMSVLTRIPASLKIVRVALYAFAVISVLASAGLILTEGSAPLVLLATFVFVTAPGAAAFLLAMLLPKRGTVLFCGLIAFGVCGILASLASVGAGLTWISQMLIPLAILIFSLRADSREFLLRP